MCTCFLKTGLRPIWHPHYSPLEKPVDMQRWKPALTSACSTTVDQTREREGRSIGDHVRSALDVHLEYEGI